MKRLLAYLLVTGYGIVLMATFARLWVDHIKIGRAHV